MPITFEHLKKLLQESGLITEEELALAQEEAARTDRSVVNVIIGRGYVAENYLAEVLSPYYGTPITDLRQADIPEETLGRIPENYAKMKSVVLFAEDIEKKIGKVAMLDPNDYDTIEFLRAKLGIWIEPYLTTESSLRYGLRQYKGRMGTDFAEIISENVGKSLSITGEVDLSKTAEAVPIITILDSIIEHAMVLNASDVHFEPLEREMLVRFRIDGILEEILSLPKSVAPILVARVKVLGNLQIDEHRIPQDGRFRFELEDGSTIDMRVNIMPVFKGEKVEMRLLKSSSKPLTLIDLGLSKEGLSIMNEEIKKPHGMILVTGPTGHGKTTTLYAVLNILNTSKVNITTIEDPIEYELPRVNQTQVNTKAGITFSNGLRALLRQNPDIIMIGEIRDAETVDIAINSALTGHLVLSSLHTNDAPSAIPRLIDMGAPDFLLASTINLVVAQRLVRRICSVCVESYTISSEIKKMIAAQIKLSDDKHIKDPPKNLFRGKGCPVCNHSGFSGQVGIFELLRVTESVRELILKSALASQIRKVAIKEGMVTMFEDGLRKVESGVTSIEEVLRVAKE